MSTTALFDVVDALVTGFATATTKPVFDGYPPRADAGLSYVAVGITDPLDDDEATVGTAEQDWQEVGSRTRNENGVVTVLIVATDPHQSARTARNTAQGIADDLAAWLRTNYTLNLAQVLWAGWGSDVTLTHNQTESGAVARVVFQVAYRAYLTA